MPPHDRIFLTDLDAARLRGVARRLIDQRGAARIQGEELFELLDEAEVIPAESVGPDVVTMNSTVAIDDTGDGHIETLTLVYPDQADVGRQRVSVLSPLGRTLIGVRAGAHVTFNTPAKSVRRIRVREVVYQPASSGDWPR